MATEYWNHDDQKHIRSYLSPDEWNVLVRQSSSQTTGALLTLGPGVVPLPGDTAWEVIVDGGSVAIRAGAGIAFHSTEGPAFMRTKSQSALSDDFPLIANTTDNFIFARAEFAAVLADPDSRETLVPLFECHDTDELDGAVLLARVNTTQTPNVITDLRGDNWITIEKLARQLVQLAADLEALEERVNAITNPDPENPSTGEVTRFEWNALLLEFNEMKAELAKLKREQNGDPLKEVRDEGEIDLLRDDWHHHLANDSHSSSTLPQRTSAAVRIPGRHGAGEKYPGGTQSRQFETGGNWPRNPRRRQFDNT